VTLNRLVVYVLGIASALFYGLAAVMQHRVAALAPKSASLRLGLLAHLIRRPMWSAAIGADVIAFVLHALALGRGPLTLVEPLLTTGLLAALALSALWERHALTRREWIGAIALTVGLAVLLAAGSPAEGRLTVPFHRWFIGGGSAAGAVVVLVVWARRSRPQLKPVSLGLAAAITFAATDSLLKINIDVLQSDGIWEVATSWYAYVLVGSAIVGEVLVQSAFQAGPLSLSLPVLTTVEPIASSALGVILFAERLRTGPKELSLELAAGVLLLFGIWVLATSPTVTGGRPDKSANEP
jgi:drug/metabolite transporter (DMT)-like permease